MLSNVPRPGHSGIGLKRRVKGRSAGPERLRRLGGAVLWKRYMDEALLTGDPANIPESAAVIIRTV